MSISQFNPFSSSSAVNPLHILNPVQRFNEAKDIATGIVSGQNLGDVGKKTLQTFSPLAASFMEPGTSIPQAPALDPNAAPDPNANAALAAEQQKQAAIVGNRQGRASTLLSGSTGDSTQGYGTARTLLGN